MPAKASTCNLTFSYFTRLSTHGDLCGNSRAVKVCCGCLQMRMASLWESSGLLLPTVSTT
jgi:hypothetical protein